LAGATRTSRFEFALEIANAFGLDRSLVEGVSMADLKWSARRPADSSLDVGRATRLLKNKPLKLAPALERLKKSMKEMK